MVEDNGSESGDLGDFTEFPDQQSGDSEGPKSAGMRLDELPTALLTQTQRRYLSGESDIEPKSSRERAVRARIRERFIYSLRDLSLLRLSLEDRDTRKMFDQSSVFGLTNAIATFLNVIGKGQDIAYPDVQDPYPELQAYEKVVEQAIELVYSQRTVHAEDLDVRIDVNSVDQPSDLAKQEFEDLSKEELSLLRRSGEIGWDRFIELINEREDS